jgi:hypothetical protein
VADAVHDLDGVVVEATAVTAQLADATFKVGTKGTHPELGDVGLASAGETTNTYIDRGNDLKFLILDRVEDRAGVLKYRVAVMKATPSPLLTYGVEVGGTAAGPEATDGILTHELPVTNTGSAVDVLRVTGASDAADLSIPNDLIELAPGQTGTVTVHVRPDAGGCVPVTLTATSEGDTRRSASALATCAGS